MKLFILCNVDTLKKPVVIVDVVLSVAKIATFLSPVFALHGWVHSSKAPLPAHPCSASPGPARRSCRVEMVRETGGEQATRPVLASCYWCWHDGIWGRRSRGLDERSSRVSATTSRNIGFDHQRFFLKKKKIPRYFRPARKACIVMAGARFSVLASSVRCSPATYYL